MALPPPATRKLSHTRSVVYRGYDREDGLWDIEAELTDIKPYTFTLLQERSYPAQEPIHHLNIRMTVDNQLTVRDIVTSLDAVPHPECHQSPVNMTALIGGSLGPGWRRQIEQHLGRTQGCTHLREMLFNMATAAFQTVASGQWHRREQGGQPQPPITQPPPYLGQCMTWAYDGPTVQRVYPMFFGQPPARPRTQTMADEPKAQR